MTGIKKTYQSLLISDQSFTLVWMNKFSKKATKFDKTFSVDLTLCSKCQINGKDFVNFCGLLGKYEL